MCNVNCGCEDVPYSPICHEATETTFFSPCHAGCQAWNAQLKVRYVLYLQYLLITSLYKFIQRYLTIISGNFFPVLLQLLLFTTHRAKYIHHRSNFTHNCQYFFNFNYSRRFCFTKTIRTATSHNNINTNKNFTEAISHHSIRYSSRLCHYIRQ